MKGLIVYFGVSFVFAVFCMGGLIYLKRISDDVRSIRKTVEKVKNDERRTD